MRIAKMPKAALENPLVILEGVAVRDVLKKHWVAGHENLVNPEQFVADFFGYLLTAGRDLDKRAINSYYKKKLKEGWKDGLSAGKPKDMFLEIMENQLIGAEVVLDFGCGKLALLKELAQSNPHLEKLIGVDLKSHPVLEGLDRRLEFQRDLQGVQKDSVDLAIIKLVLHHLESVDEIEEILKDIKKVLRPGGRLIIFEESFPLASCEIVEIKKYLAEFNLELSEATVDFLHLSEADKINFLFLNDWLMNVQNSYMPWTGLYQSIEDWKFLGEELGFTEKEVHFLGAIAHRKRKQGMTAYLVWEK